MRLALLPEAFLEIDETVTYYERQRPGLGVEFYLEVEATVELAAERPGIGSPVLGSVRLSLLKYAVKRFPFLVRVAGDGDERRIVAVAHARRRPGYWRERLRWPLVPVLRAGRRHHLPHRRTAWHEAPRPLPAEEGSRPV